MLHETGAQQIQCILACPSHMGHTDSPYMHNNPLLSQLFTQTQRKSHYLEPGSPYFSHKAR